MIEMIPLVRLRGGFLSEKDEENKKNVARITEQEACVFVAGEQTAKC